MLINLKCYFNQSFISPSIYDPLKNWQGGGIKTKWFLQHYLTLLFLGTPIFCLQALIRHILMLTNLNQYLTLLSVLLLFGCVLILSPFGFLTTYLHKIWNFHKVFVWIRNLKLQRCFKHVKWQIQEVFKIVTLSNWTGEAAEPAASWFLPPWPV